MPQEVATMISTVGFPITCTVFMAYYIVKVQKELITALNNVNIALTKINEHIKDEDERDS